MVEDQETRVHRAGEAFECNIERAGMAAKVVGGLEHRDLRDGADFTGGNEA